MMRWAFADMWVYIGLAAHLHYGRGPGLQLPLQWVAAAFGQEIDT